MGFKLKTKAEIFGYNEELSEWGRPVFEKDLKGSIMAEANNDGTTFIDKSLSPAQKKEAVEHEGIHHDQMNQGKLGYTDYMVTWKKDTKSPTRVYKRDQGNIIAMNSNESGEEGDSDFPWEDEAYKNS